MKIALTTDKQKAQEPQWETFHDNGDGEPVRVKLRPWGRSAETLIADQAKDKEYVASLKIPWDELPKGSGNRRLEVSTVLMADFIIEEWEGFVGDDEKTSLPCTLVAKVFFFEFGASAMWALDRARHIGLKVIETEQKN